MLLEGRTEEPFPQVYTDSAYAYNVFTTWMFTWAKNEWKKSNKKQPENLELIKFYYRHWQKGYRINLNLIRGHAGNKWNELADKIATGKIKPQRGGDIIDEWNEMADKLAKGEL